MIVAVENNLFMDHYASSISLIIKHNQNLNADMDSSKYPAHVSPVIECLNASILMKGLIQYEEVLMSTLILAYSNASYNKDKDTLSFEVHGHKPATSRLNFYKLVGLPTNDSLYSPYLLTSSQCSMFFTK